MAALLSGCSFLPSLCENTVEKEVISPNGLKKAVIFDRGCGATVGFITAISIVPNGESLKSSDTGNVLLAENIYKEVSGTGNAEDRIMRENFDIEWLNDMELLVRYTESKNLRKYRQLGNLTVKFEQLR